MNVKLCEKCGEELFGAVNACWKCGNEIAIPMDDAKPPIRRAPVQLRPASPAAAGASDIGLASRLTPGSSAGQAMTAIQALPFPLSIPLSENGYHWCAVTSVVLGVVAIFVGLFTAWNLPISIIGIGFGVKGMEARRRDLATMGLVLCVMSVFVVIFSMIWNAWVRYAASQIVDGFDTNIGR